MKSGFACSFRGCGRAAVALVLGLVLPWRAAANPNGATVSQGTAAITTAGSRMTIQTSDRAYINWQSFNIGLGETTTFVQPSSTSLVWNSINDPNPSQILGTLNANGYVVLQNQSGFYIGGQAAINAGGLIMTTAPTPMPDLSSGGAWEFNAPPPAAKIINYGQINLGNGGSAFLIASDIENQGTISAPQGNIGLYAGKQVLVSTRPDGRGLSATVTLPQGSVDNSGNLIADAGTIALNAQVVNQGGLIQANSIREQNGVIELLADDSLTLGASSVISAKGDTQGTSPGGIVVAKSGNTFSDASGSSINVAGGTAGGQNGLVEVFGTGVTASSIQSQIDNLPASQFGSQNFLAINPYNITLSALATTASAASPNFNVADLAAYSQIALFANNNIELSTLTPWTIADAVDPSSLTLSAGNNVTLDNGAGIRVGQNWAVSLTAGTALTSGSLPAAGADSILLNGNSMVQSRNDDIDLTAPNQVTVNSGAVRTLNGGSINVSTQYGDVNTGTGTLGFTYNLTPSPTPPYYYSVSSSLGGISTAAGGNVTISAGGNVTSYFPNVSASTTIARADPGTGAFGPEPGNVTITAGGSIYGHYVLANGIGSLTAGQNLGNSGQNVALSLVAGTWNLNAPNGNIYLQEVRNPDGVFDQPQSVNSAAYHLFDYDPNAGVDLTAGLGVYLTGQSLPRLSVAVPVIYPPSLDISAGPGGVNLGSSVILFPSPDQNLDITTTGGGGFSADSAATQLSMSDSSHKRYTDTSTFGTTDHAAAPPELNNPDPVLINISGSMNNINLAASKEASITVGGDMNSCNFTGQNLHANDITSINVAGRIYDPGSFNSVLLGQSVPVLPVGDTSPQTVDNWEAILAAAVNPAIGSVNVPGSVSPSQYYSLYVAPALLFGSTLSSFRYNQSTGRLTYVGPMDSTVANELEQPLTVVKYGPDGNPLVVNNQIQTETLSWVPSPAIQTLYTASQGAPALTALTGGYQIGGPGQFNINASSLSLGNSLGILSYGSGGQYGNLAPYVQAGGGASINVTLNGNLAIPGSTIATLGGGNVKVESLAGSMDLGSQDLLDVENLIVQAHGLALGIYSSGGGNVDVTALGNINVDSSRIATFDGGNVSVESFQGSVDAGSGGTTSIPVYVYYVDPVTGRPGSYLEYVYASGIVAETLVQSSQVPGGAVIPGDIMVTTPQGDIDASLGGILQESLNGVVSAGPVVTLKAGTDPDPNVPGSGFIDNINLGNSGVIGGTVNVSATGTITGLVISRESSSVVAQQSFIGTVLSGGSANVTAVSGSVTGTVIGVGGANVSGGSGVSALVLGQNVSVNGSAATSTLGTSSSASTASQSAAGVASADAQAQVADTAPGDDELNKKKKLPLLTRLVGRVTVILPKL